MAFRHANRLFTTPRPPASPGRKHKVDHLAKRLDLPMEDGRIVVWIWGQAERKVVLLHGWEGRSSQWHPMVERLLQHGFQVIAVDPPGHGSSRGWKRANLPLFARTLLRVEAEFGPLDCVVGHSLGGAALVRALSLGLDAKRAAVISAPARPRRYWIGLLKVLGLPQRRVQAFDRRFEAFYGFTWEELDIVRLASERMEPALVIHDLQDREVPAEEARLLAEAWPGATLLHTDGLGHNRLLGAPEVIQAVLAFAAA
jgi:pimeloyl-ACP methyl ester carboxylesterase